MVNSYGQIPEQSLCSFCPEDIFHEVSTDRGPDFWVSSLPTSQISCPENQMSLSFKGCFIFYPTFLYFRRILSICSKILKTSYALSKRWNVTSTIHVLSLSIYLHITSLSSSLRFHQTVFNCASRNNIGLKRTGSTRKYIGSSYLDKTGARERLKKKFLDKSLKPPLVVAHTFNSSSLGAEAGGSLF